MFVVVSCRVWGAYEDGKMLEAHAKTDHSDVCLSFLFTAHQFKKDTRRTARPQRDLLGTVVSLSNLLIGPDPLRHCALIG